MINIAIVEDTDSEAEVLTGCLNLFGKEKNVEFKIERFADADSFLTNYRPMFDLVFMDIELPCTNGMKASFKLREFDKEIIIIFVTNMAKYAVKGYEVDALDYMLKPVIYQKFAIKMQKAIELINAKNEIELVVQQMNGLVRLSTKRIQYIEVSGHKLSYVTDGGVVGGYGSLSDLEKRLASRDFMRCNSCYLINPRYVASIEGDIVIMKNGDKLKISKTKRKSFMSKLTTWLGQGNFA